MIRQINISDFENKSAKVNFVSLAKSDKIFLKIMVKMLIIKDY